MDSIYVPKINGLIVKITTKILYPPKEDTRDWLKKYGVDFWLSVSKAKSFSQCKRLFKFSYIDKLPKIEFDFHVFGKFMHKILEDFHCKLQENPELNQKKLMTECFKDALNEFGERLSKELKDEGFEICKSYLKFYDNTRLQSEFLYFEKPFYVIIDDKILLNGFIDLIKLDSDGVIHVADYKTTQNSIYLKDKFQLLVYAYVIMLEDPTIDLVRTSYVMLRGDKQDDPKEPKEGDKDYENKLIEFNDYKRKLFKYITFDITRKQAFAVEKKLLKYFGEISEEKLWRPKPQFLCKYCSYIEKCDEGQKFLISINQGDEFKEPCKIGKQSW